MITADIDGVRYSNFTSATAEIRLDTLSNGFSLTAIDPNPTTNKIPVIGGETCKIYVNDKLVLTGNVEVVGVEYSRNDHVVTISGRDRTGDLVDSTIENMDSLIGDGLTLKLLIEKVIENIGLDIKVIDLVKPKPFSLTEDLAIAEVGENAFGFIEKYAQKREVLLTSDANGNVVIAKNSGIMSPGNIKHKIESNNNNVLSASYSNDLTGRFNLYKVASGLNLSTVNLAGLVDSESIVNQNSSATDSEIRSTRRLIIQPDISYSSLSSGNRAKWEKNVREARGQVYEVVVDGFEFDGDLWEINRIYSVDDDFIGIKRNMLTNSVTFSYDLDQGSVTTLGMVGDKAYTIESNF